MSTFSPDWPTCPTSGSRYAPCAAWRRSAAAVVISTQEGSNAHLRAYGADLSAKGDYTRAGGTVTVEALADLNADRSGTARPLRSMSAWVSPALEWARSRAPWWIAPSADSSRPPHLDGARGRSQSVFPIPGAPSTPGRLTGLLPCVWPYRRRRIPRCRFP